MAWYGDSAGHAAAARKGAAHRKHHAVHTYEYKKVGRRSKGHPAGRYEINDLGPAKRHRGLFGPKPAPKGRRRTGLKK